MVAVVVVVVVCVCVCVCVCAGGWGCWVCEKALALHLFWGFEYVADAVTRKKRKKAFGAGNKVHCFTTTVDMMYLR